MPPTEQKSLTKTNIAFPGTDSETAQSDIKSLIYVIRNQQVMLDSDLAMLYQVETKRLNEAVKRNNSRFPEKFRFQLTKDECENLKSQIATSSFHIPLSSVESEIFLEILRYYVLPLHLIALFLLDTASLNHCLS